MTLVETKSLLPHGTTTSIAEKALGQLELIKDYPQGSFHYPDHVVWDNWALTHKGQIHRYALFAPTETEAHERHFISRIVHGVSDDNGETWSDLKPIKIDGLNLKDDEVLWSGSAISHQGKINLFFTLTNCNEEGLPQKIYKAESFDGVQFNNPQEVFSPTSHQWNELGYHLGTDDGVEVMALRDPHIAEFDDMFHMFFATKAEADDGNIYPAIGYATCTDENLNDWELQKPIKVFEDSPGSQFEVPGIMKHGNQYFMFLSRTDNPSGETTRDKQSSTVMYQADTLQGPWEAYDGEQGKIRELGDDAYALNLCRMNNNEIAGAAFYSEHTKLPFVGTPLLEIGSNKGIPQIITKV